jgi:hypothetical protein
MKRRSDLDRASERRFLSLAAVLFGVLVLINYWPVFLGQVPLPAHVVTQFPAWGDFNAGEPWQPVADIGDLVDYFYPFNAFSAEQIRRGTIPLWNPYVMSGMPFQAEPQTALFYPLHALYYVFSTPTAWAFALILRMFLGAMFMTLLARAVGCTRAGAIVSGIVFAYSGFMVAWQGAVMGDAVMWLPLMCYAVLRLHARRSRRTVCLVAFAFAMPVLAGHPETAAHVILTGSAAAVLIWMFPPRSEQRLDMRFLAAFTLAGLLAIGLAAVQLLPTLEWTRSSGRNLTEIWPSLDLHQAFGFFSRDALRGPNSARILVPNAMGYAGMFTLLAAALGLLHGARRYVVWFAALVVVGFAASFGLEPVRWILTHTPIVQALKNERLILLVDFGLAALAGLGVSVLQAERREGSFARRALPWLIVIVVFIAGIICVQELRQATELRVETMRRPSFSRTLLIAGFLLTAWKLSRMQRAKLFPFVACALVAFDLGTFAYGYSGFAKRDRIFPPSPVFEFFQEKGRSEVFRTARLGEPYPINSGIAYGVQSLTGFEATIPPALEGFVWDFTEGYQASLYLVGRKLLDLTDRRFDMLNVKYLAVPVTDPQYEMLTTRPDRFAPVFKSEKVAVFENEMALPRAFVVGVEGVMVVADAAEQLESLRDSSFDPTRSVILDSLPSELTETATSLLEEFRGSVEILQSDVNGYRFRVEASTPAILVVSQDFHTSWKAAIDGKPLSVFRADLALTGIYTPAGTSEITFRFEPLTFRAGVWISIASAIILVFCRRGRRSASATARRIKL